MREKTCLQNFQGTLSITKDFFKSSLIPPPPTLIYFLTDEYSLEDKQSQTQACNLQGSNYP